MIKDQKLFDLSFLEEMDGNNFIAEVLTLFIRETEEDLAAMKLACDTGAFDTVCEIAHKLKGSTGMIQANTLWTLLEQIEELAKSSDSRVQVADHVLKASLEFDRLKTALQQFLKELQDWPGAK